MQPWVRYLARHGHVPRSTVLEMDRLISTFLTGEIDHDELAIAVNCLYASSMAGAKVEDVKSLSFTFASRDIRNLYKFSPLLFDILERRGIEVRIVSGAPTHLLAEYAKLLRVPEPIGFTIASAHGMYQDSVLRNPGTSTDKHRIVREFKMSGRQILLAAGDSSSDLPMLKAANVRIVVDNEPLGRHLTNSIQLVSANESTSWTRQLDTLLNGIGSRGGPMSAGLG